MKIDSGGLIQFKVTLQSHYLFTQPCAFYMVFLISNAPTQHQAERRTNHRVMPAWALNLLEDGVLGPPERKPMCTQLKSDVLPEITNLGQAIKGFGVKYPNHRELWGTHPSQSSMAPPLKGDLK